MARTQRRRGGVVPIRRAGGRNFGLHPWRVDVGSAAISDRDLLATNDVVGGDEIERAAAYSSYIAYAGTYEVVGDVVTHRVKMSLFPNWVDAEQRRYLEIDGDQIVLRTQQLDIGGDVQMTELRWAREE